MTILFYGDPHGDFGSLIEAANRLRPAHAVILGDLELERPFREEMAPLTALGIRCWYIVGNHDVDNEARHDFLLADYPEGNLGGRVVELPCVWGVVRIAGLGGVYKGRIWRPDSGQPPRFQTRAEFIRACRPGDRWRGGMPLGQRDTIFPEDHERLATLRTDVLVCHEAPSCQRNGVPAIDGLARAMGCRLVVHGHHHEKYDGITTDGIRVRGLDGREPYLLEAAP